MRITFWGTRGSIAQSGIQTLRYGGHTSCVEIRSRSNDLLVLDAGTGLQGLSRALLTESTRPRTSSILISHTHWDHIQGLPFFTPFFLPNQQWNLFGPSSLSLDLETALRGQMQQTYFPITPDIFNANMTYHDVVEGHFEIGDIKVTTRYLNHPGVTLGYRIEVDGYTVVYSTDHEPHDCRLAHGGQPLKGSEDDLHGQFLAQADYVIHDTQYLANEYEQRRGWGHSTMEYVVDLAHRADVKNLVMFHHDPLRTDQELDGIIDMGRERVRGRPGVMEITGASEHLPIQPFSTRKVITPKPATYTATYTATDSALSPLRPDMIESPTLASSPILYFPSNSDRISELIQKAGHSAIPASDHQDLSAQYALYSPHLIIVQVSSFAELRACYGAIFTDPLGSAPPTVVLLCQAHECIDQDMLLTLSPQPIRLVEPVSDLYLSSRIQTWINRAHHGVNLEVWERAHIPHNDVTRAEVAIKILEYYRAERAPDDTRVTVKSRVRELVEIAWQMMMIPSHQEITLSINLITHDAQETIISFPVESDLSAPRDTSMCSHVIAKEDPIYALDVLEDPLLKNHATFTQTPTSDLMRTYIGFPLKVSTYFIGTFCCTSRNQTYFYPEQLKGVNRIVSLIEGLLQDVIN